MDDAPFLNVGAESDRYLVQVSAEDRTVPNRGAIPNSDLPGKNDVGGDVSVDSNLRQPLPQGDDPALATVVPLHAIRRSRRWRRSRRRNIRRRCGLSGEETAGGEEEAWTGKGSSRESSKRCRHFQSEKGREGHRKRDRWRKGTRTRHWLVGSMSLPARAIGSSNGSGQKAKIKKKKKSIGVSSSLNSAL